MRVVHRSHSQVMACCMVWVALLLALGTGAAAQFTYPVKFINSIDFLVPPAELLLPDCEGQCCIDGGGFAPPVICSAKLESDGLVLYAHPDEPDPEVKPCIGESARFFWALEIDYLYEASSFLVEKR